MNLMGVGRRKSEYRRWKKEDRRQGAGNRKPKT